MKTDLIKAVDLALAKDWDAAHAIVQRHEGNATAAWIHAVLHKIEGDLGNSRYWYRQCGKLEFTDAEPRSELVRIKTDIASAST